MSAPEDWGFVPPPADQTPLPAESPSIMGRIGQRATNLPSELLNSLMRLGYNAGIREPNQTQPESVPTPYNIPEAKTGGETAVDIGSKLVESVPFFISGEGAGEGLAKVISAGPMLARMMKVGGGFAAQGATESPKQAGVDATLGAGMGAVEAMLPGPLRYLAAAGLGAGTGLLAKEEGASNHAAFIQGAVNTILPLLFGVRAPKVAKTLAEDHPGLEPYGPSLPGYRENIGLTERYDLSLEGEQQRPSIEPPLGSLIREPKFSEGEARTIAESRSNPRKQLRLTSGEDELPFRNTNGSVDIMQPPPARGENPFLFTPPGSIVEAPVFTQAEARRKAGIQPPKGSLIRNPTFTENEARLKAGLKPAEDLIRPPTQPTPPRPPNAPRPPKPYEPQVATLQQTNGKARLQLSTVFHPENKGMAQAAADKLGIEFKGFWPESNHIEFKIPEESSSPAKGANLTLKPNATYRDLKNKIAAKEKEFKDRAPTPISKEKTGILPEAKNSIDLSSEDAIEVTHKLGVLADSPDLHEGYGLTKQQVDSLAQSVPTKGKWNIPDWAVEAVQEELKDHALVLRDQASDQRRNLEHGLALRISKQAKRLEEKVATLQPPPSPLETRLPHDLNAGDKARATIDGEHVIGTVHPGIEEETVRFVEKNGTEHDLLPSKISPLGTKPPPAANVEAVGGLSELESAKETSQTAGGARSLGDSGGKMKLSNFGEHGGLPADIAIILGRYAVAPVAGAVVGYASDENHRIGSAIAGAVIGGFAGHGLYRLIKLMAEAHPEVKVAGSVAEKLSKLRKAAKDDSKEFAKAIVGSPEKASRAATKWGVAVSFDEMARWIEKNVGRNSFVVRAVDKAHAKVQDLSDAIKKSVVGLSEIKDIDSHFEDITKYFEGKITHTQLMSLVPANVSSLAATAKLGTETLQKILAEGLGKGKLSTKVEQSIGSYLTTAYKIFHDPKYKPTDAQIFAAAKAMSSEWGNLESRLIKINEYLTEVKQNKGLYGSGGESLGSALARKQELSSEFKAMLGEYDSPLERMSHTAIKLVNAAKSAEFFNEVARGSKPGGLKYAYTTSEYEAKVATLQQQARLGHTPEAREAAAQALIELKQYAWNAEGPTSGRLQHSMMDRAVRDQLSNYTTDLKASSSAMMRGVMNTTNLIKYGQIILSPLQFVRQVYQMPILGIMAKTNPRDWLKSISTLYDKSAAGLTELNRLKRLGVYGGDTVAGMFREDMGHLMNGNIDNVIFKKLSKGLHQWEELWRTPDLVIRVASFQRAEARFIEQMGRGEEATNAAIDHMNRYTMNYGAVPPIVKYGRQLPFVNQYLSFTFEAMRITKNLIQDAAKGDIHAIGALSTLAVAPFIIQQMSEAQLSPQDKKDWDQVKALGKPYERYNFRFVQGRNPNGDFRYISFSPLVLHDPLLQSFRAAMAGDVNALADTNPFVGWNNTPLLNVASSLVTQRNRVTDQPLLSFGDYAQSIRGDVAPILLGSDLDRIQRALRPNDEGGLGVIDQRSGKVSSIEDILQTYLTSMRPYTVRPAYLLKQAKAEATDRIRSQQQMFRQVVATNASAEVKQQAKMNYDTAVQHILLSYHEKLGINVNESPGQ